jgi:alpha-glucosidase
MTFPSMPMMTYGDEIGMEGTFGEDGRRPMPWDENAWDAGTLEVYRGLISARQRSIALRRGGLRWVHAEGDAMVYLRETLDEVALVHVARAAHEPVVLDPRHLDGIASGSSLYGPAPKVRKRAVTLSASGPVVSIWTWRPTDDGPRHVRRRVR